LGHALIFLFGFACGAVVLILWVLFLLYRFLGYMNDKTNELNMRKERVKPKENNPDIPPRTRREVGCYVKIQTVIESEFGVNKTVPWLYAVLRENSVFVFQESSKERLETIINLDNCNIKVPHKNWASPTNAIEISNPDTAVYNGNHIVFMYFPIGKELEDWYWRLSVASQLSKRYDEINDREELVFSTFDTLREKVFGDKKEGEPLAPEAWANALLPRLWWNIFDNKSFHRFAVKRLGKRIAKITDFPKFIDSMVLHNIDIGPTLPFISNIELVELTPDGEMDIDLDLDYTGCFSLTIKIKTSINLPGTSLELPATAILNVHRVTGRLRIHVSSPPCERFWIGFHKLPETDIKADTIISLLDFQNSSQIGIPRIANSIIKKLKSDLTKVVVNKLKSDILGEKMVLPNMDDFPIPYFTHHEGEEEEDYISQVILSRESTNEKEKKKRGGPAVLDISPSGVTILKKKIEGDQIFPLLKAYATKDGVKKLTTSGVRTLQECRPQIKENMEKGKQAIIESGMTNPKNWKDTLPNLETVKGSVVDGLYRYGVKKIEKDVPPDYLQGNALRAMSSDRKVVRKKLDKPQVSPRTHARRFSSCEIGKGRKSPAPVKRTDSVLKKNEGT